MGAKILNTCTGCLYDLGGEHCRINLELECAAGDHQMYRAAAENYFSDINTASIWAGAHYPAGYQIVRSGAGYVVKGEK